MMGLFSYVYYSSLIRVGCISTRLWISDAERKIADSICHHWLDYADCRYVFDDDGAAGALGGSETVPRGPRCEGKIGHSGVGWSQVLDMQSILCAKAQ